MATTKHKAATAVTLAPLAERSAFEVFVHKYWMHGAVVAVGITAGALVWHYLHRQEAHARAESWDKLVSGAAMDSFQKIPTATPAVLGDLSTQLRETAAGPWARLLEAQARLGERDYAGARAALDGLRSEHPEHALTRDDWPGDGSAPQSAVARMLVSIEQQERWESQHGGLFANPPVPADAPRVRLTTDQGDISLALFTDRAPQHSANFLALVKEGYFNGTKIHAVTPGLAIEGGDPISRDQADSTLWGRGPSDRVVSTESTGLYHFGGVLSAAPGANKSESSGNLFALTCEPRHEWDGQRVVFGAVIEGLEVVRTIANSPLATNSESVLAQPIVLQSAQQP